MNLWSAISVGLKEIWAHKFRSLLTMLGIILGASSLIAMSALVKGREVAAKEALIATGGLQKIRIEPQEVPIHQWHLKDQAVGVTINDAYALEASAPLVARISPEMRLFNPTSSRKGKSFRPWLCSGRLAPSPSRCTSTWSNRAACSTKSTTKWRATFV